jgi:hypothetical protein
MGRGGYLGILKSHARSPTHPGRILKKDPNPQFYLEKPGWTGRGGSDGAGWAGFAHPQNFHVNGVWCYNKKKKKKKKGQSFPPN